MSELRRFFRKVLYFLIFKFAGMVHRRETVGWNGGVNGHSTV